VRILRLGGRGWDCNQFLVKDEKANAYDMVDAGHGMDFEHVLAGVAAVIDPTRIRSIAVTHEHLDHVNGLPKWQALGGRVVASAPCAAKLRAGHDPTSAQFGIDIPHLEVDDVVADGDTVRLGGRDFAVVAGPGHSPGALCFWHEADAILFAGDTLFADGGIGRFDFPDGDLARLYETVLRLGRLPVRTLHCGHGPSVEGDDAARSVAASVQHVSVCREEATSQ
jgi:glyoxylase-like metal-dependent hydrolase (beta-lactamase superfamily II)